MASSRIVVLTVLALTFLITAHAADISGKWTSEFDTPIGVQNYTYDLKVDGEKLTGTATNQRGSVEIQEGKVSGDEVSFVEMLDFEGQEIRIEYTGKVDGDEMKLVRQVGEFATEHIVAKRAQ